MSTRPLLPLVTAGGAGLLFGIGLAIAQMTDPAKILNFLDLAAIGTGTWDPSVVFVMGAGLLVTALIYRLARPMPSPLVTAAFAALPPARIDRSLVLGSAVFGIGWGMSGLCPGPAIADLGLAPGEVALFVAALLIGSWGAGLVLTAGDGRSFLSRNPDAAAG